MDFKAALNVSAFKSFFKHAAGKSIIFSLIYSVTKFA
jgi:hypothetical protein